MARLTADQLATLQADFEDLHPRSILHWAMQTFGNRLALVTSFQPTGIATAHMLSEIAPRTPIITLDTGLLFNETVQLIDELESLLHLNVRRIKPAQTVKQQSAEYGPDLWSSDPDRCCHMRKVLPLNDALSGFDAWITGLRRDQSERRRQTPIIDVDPRRPDMIKLAPFATWDESMIWTYIHAYELPYNDLHDRGYPSIGCWPCTRAVSDGEGTRDGRWSGRAKTECGIHIARSNT